MQNLIEEELPKIKPPFTLSEDVDKTNLKKWIIKQEAEEIRPPITRTLPVETVLGEGNNRILVFQYLDIPLFMFIEEAPDYCLSKTNEELLKERISFKVIGQHDDKIVVSHKAILEFYKTAAARGKIMSGKIIDIKPGREMYSRTAYIFSKGDTIIVKNEDFAFPYGVPPTKRIGHIIDFVVKEVKGNKIYGSTRIVSEFRQEQLEYFYENEKTFKTRVEKVENQGALLTYKNNNPLILRNRDFSSNFTACKDILSEGDTIEVKIKEIIKNQKEKARIGDVPRQFEEPLHRVIAELVKKYNVAPTLDYKDIFPEQTYHGEIVNVEAFGAFVRISIGRDVLCPINFEKREPIIGDKVEVEIIVSNEELGRLRGKIIKYEDDLPDLSDYNLIGENYDY